MKTKLPTSINTIDHAKVFLTALHKNGESFHPEDDANDIDWQVQEPPTKEESSLLNKLMADIFNLEGNENYPVSYIFDPCEWLLDLDIPDPVLDIDRIETQIKSISTDQTGGNIYNDVITLKNGHVIRISEDDLSVYTDSAKDEIGDDLTHCSFIG